MWLDDGFFLLLYLVRSIGLFGPFQLYFKSLHANLKSIHGLDGGLSAVGIIEADESLKKFKNHIVFLDMNLGKITETFALICGSVNENFGADDVSEGQEHLHELCITKLLRKVIDEEITALGA